MKWIFLSLAVACASAHAQVQVRDAWSRATPPGAKVGAGYARLENGGGQPDRLLGATTTAAARVEMHVTEEKDGVSRMRQVQSFEVPARGRFELRPGGAHLMLVDLAKPLVEGSRIRMRLRFERGGEVEAGFEVRAMGARGGGHSHGH